MYCTASTECYPDLPLHASLEKLGDLEFSRVEICIREEGKQLKPSEVHADLDRTIRICRDTCRLTPVAYVVDIKAPGKEYYKQFEACCKLAKATKVVSITVPAGELGTPYNAEIERLRELVKIGSLEGILVSIKTEVGTVTQDPANAVALCETVKGLGLTLDPTHYTYTPLGTVDYDNTFKYVYHVQLRDSKKNAFQVRVGQGEIEYGRLVTELTRYRYNKALCINMPEIPDVDHNVEMRKMRLLIESLLL